MSPMPGLVVSLDVKVGQEVKAGEGVAIVEAMKMENELRALVAGTVESVHVKPGDAVDGVTKIPGLRPETADAVINQNNALTAGMDITRKDLKNLKGEFTAPRVVGHPRDGRDGQGRHERNDRPKNPPFETSLRRKALARDRKSVV